jgi:hypothetical protein
MLMASGYNKSLKEHLLEDTLSSSRIVLVTTAKDDFSIFGRFHISENDEQLEGKLLEMCLTFSVHF